MPQLSQILVAALMLWLSYLFMTTQRSASLAQALGVRSAAAAVRIQALARGGLARALACVAHVRRRRGGVRGAAVTMIMTYRPMQGLETGREKL